MKVWLDDIRPAPKGWVHVKTAAEAIALLKTGEVEEISLDNDLGDGEPEGYTVADYIESAIVLHYIVPPKDIHIHTGNPVAAERMEQTVKSIRRFEAVLKRCVEEGVED